MHRHARQGEPVTPATIEPAEPGTASARVTRTGRSLLQTGAHPFFQEPAKLGELMQVPARASFDPERRASRDVFSEVYEYFSANSG